MSSFLDYLKAAFIHPVNWMGLGLFGIIALVTFNPLFFILTGIWEVGWVAGAPAVPAFRASVDKKMQRDRITQKEKEVNSIVRELTPEVRERYMQLKSIATNIRDNYEKGTSPSAVFLEQISNRTDELLGRYLKLLKTRDVYLRHIEENAPGALKDKLAILDAEIAHADDKVAEVKARQREILQKRYKKSLKAEKDYHLLEAQIETIEELVKLLNSQAVSITQPEEINSQFDSIMSEMEVTESTMAELHSSFDELFDEELEKSMDQKRLES